MVPKPTIAATVIRHDPTNANLALVESLHSQGLGPGRQRVVSLTVMQTSAASV